MSNLDQLENGLALLKLSAEVDVDCWDDVHKAAVLVLSRAIERVTTDTQAKNEDILRLNTFIDQWKEAHFALEKRFNEAVDQRTNAIFAQEKAEAERARLYNELQIARENIPQFLKERAKLAIAEIDGRSVGEAYGILRVFVAGIPQ